MKVAFVVLLGAVAALAAPTEDLGWRIVGGEAAKDGQYPYQISLRYSGSHSCGGSILDETTIICAAHCVDGRSASRMTVVTGTNKLNQGGDTYQVKSFVRHENYDDWEITNDISIIKLEKPIQFNDKVQPVELRTTPIEGDQECTLSGWGTLIAGGNLPNDLQHIKLKTLSNKECVKSQSGVIDSQVCTLTKSGEGACNGDSGGPLVDADGKQIGIVSYGIPCGRGYPDVFTRVTSFLDWIEANRN